MRNKVEVVLFDLDDTLYLEEDYVKSGMKQISKIISSKYNYFVNEVYSELMRLYSSRNDNVFNRFFDAHDITYSEKEIQELVKAYREHNPDISFCNDTILILKYLKSRRIKTGIITDGFSVAQHKKLDSLNCSGYFDKIIVTDDLGEGFWKPNPKAFKIMREHFKCDYHKMMYLGDNPKKDFYISTILPIKTVRINRNGVYKNEKYLENIKENYMIYSFTELIELLEEGI